MKLVFLCGGIGKRMFPIMESKFLLKFLGKTLLEHHIEMAEKSGFDKFVIVANPENIGSVRKVMETEDVDVEFAIQQNPLGIADALLSAEKLIENDEIVIVNPNDVVEESAYKLLIENSKGAADAYVIGQERENYFPGGYLIVDKKDVMQGIVEKPAPGAEPSNLVNIVIHYYKNTKKLMEYLKTTKSDKDDVYEKAMDRMIKDGAKFQALRYRGVWRAIKFPWNIFDITKFLLDKSQRTISPNARIAPSAVVEGNVIIEDGARIFENACIKGPCYIGKNTVVGNNALIRSYTHIGSNCVIGFSTEIKNCYIGDNCWFHQAYAGDSIISNNCHMAAGAITANFRLDEKTIKVNIFSKGETDSGLRYLGIIMGEDCKLGCNVTTMPGKKIGPNSIVGPGVVLKSDLEPNKSMFLKQEHVIKDIDGNAFADKLSKFK
ncbi:MAG: sugar phosphate nucleotidyltransferase [Candidatus Aenigmatarchaeota archaeon]